MAILSYTENRKGKRIEVRLEGRRLDESYHHGEGMRDVRTRSGTIVVKCMDRPNGARADMRLAGRIDMSVPEALMLAEMLTRLAGLEVVTIEDGEAKA